MVIKQFAMTHRPHCKIKSIIIILGNQPMKIHKNPSKNIKTINPKSIDQ